MFIAYYRVSTPKQGRSGLGLDAQREAVRAFIGQAPEVEFTEIESGGNSQRPELNRALDHAELTGATLIVAKLDRLSRDAAFLMTLHKSQKVKVVFADMPFADTVMIGVMATVAQWEREQISKRTRAAMDVVKQRGVKLGGDRGNLPSVCALGARRSAEKRGRAARDRSAKVRPYIDAARAAGATSLRQIAAHLNSAGITSPRGKAWTATAVQRVLS